MDQQYFNREKIIINYVEGYNQFDIEKMVTDFDQKVMFENIENGKVTISIKGVEAFRQLAEQSKSYFEARNQTVRKIKHIEDRAEIEIDYSAVLAMDFPNGMEKGTTLALKGKSIFTFKNDKVIKLVDVS